MTYQQYLRSEHWQKRRRKLLSGAGYMCEECGASHCELHVHHKDYSRRGNERYTDLLVLCKKCHMARHGEQP